MDTRLIDGQSFDVVWNGRGPLVNDYEQRNGSFAKQMMRESPDYLAQGCGLHNGRDTAGARRTARIRTKAARLVQPKKDMRGKSANSQRALAAGREAWNKRQKIDAAFKGMGK